ncbi:hypothetical protein PRIPAC_84792 [Pristionchus pacificus]|uniref:Transp_Tc5_C domain-containing protein n=1 Tax=Pristionchus pacificus TaxID=54126 RepID=A0A2A6BTY2_PRIPA|nr:hypothetical protein PRIPAC_84792 [Pristionchus pacificus]|eukprot:PDM69360.1 hypothetical protein PRIPAC_47662 [Pristionchus pacificus]
MDFFAVSAKAVAAVVASSFDPSLDIPVTRDALNFSEKKWADRLIAMLRGAESGELVVCERVEAIKEDGHEEEEEWDFEEPIDQPATNTRHTWTTEMMNEAYAFYRTGHKLRNPGKEGCRSLTSMNKKFRWLKTDQDLRTLVHYGKSWNKPTNRNEQLRLLAEALDEEVTALIDSGAEFHDYNLRRWRSVTGRHITKIVSVKKKKDEGKIKEQVDELRAQVQQIVEEHPDIYIWNCDQTGMVKEAHGKRTLARKGVKQVVCVAQSVGATTSSITLLPIIGMDGYVKPKIFVQLGEPGGKLPKKGCYRDSTLDIAVATSHIMSKLSAIQFYKEVLFSGFVPPKLLLILDSWPAFKDHDAIRLCAPPNCQLFIVNIPPGGTAMCQPADISFNHQLKGIQKRLKSIILAKKIDYRISQRDNLLKFVSQLHWCMGADRFKGFISYGFYKGGFTTTKPAPFESPKDYMFGSGSMAACDNCSSLSCTKCPRCEKPHCFDCFWNKLHRC